MISANSLPSLHLVWIARNTYGACINVEQHLQRWRRYSAWYYTTLFSLLSRRTMWLGPPSPFSRTPIPARFPYGQVKYPSTDLAAEWCWKAYVSQAVLRSEFQNASADTWSDPHQIENPNAFYIVWKQNSFPHWPTSGRSRPWLYSQRYLALAATWLAESRYPTFGRCPRWIGSQLMGRFPGHGSVRTPRKRRRISTSSRYESEVPCANLSCWTGHGQRHHDLGFVTWYFLWEQSLLFVVSLSRDNREYEMRSWCNSRCVVR